MPGLIESLYKVDSIIHEVFIKQINLFFLSYLIC